MGTADKKREKEKSLRLYFVLFLARLFLSLFIYFMNLQSLPNFSSSISKNVNVIDMQKQF